MKILAVSLLVLASIITFAFMHSNYEQKVARNTSSDHLQQSTFGQSKAEEEKSWYVIGDSITADSQYPHLIGQNLNIENITVDAGPNRPFSQLSHHLDEESLKEADLITIFAGTHDYGGNTPLGSIEDEETANSFYGHVQALINKIQAVKKPEAKIVLMTPIIRGSVLGSETSPEHPDRNGEGHTLEDYVEALVEVGEQHEIEVINLFHESGITLDNIEEYTSDNLRLNHQGDQLIAEIITNKLIEQEIWNEGIVQ